MSAQSVQEWERTCGPWYPGDRPEDIVTDIALCGGEVTLAQAQAYAAELNEPREVLCEARCESGTGAGTCPTCGTVYTR